MWKQAFGAISRKLVIHNAMANYRKSTVDQHEYLQDMHLPIEIVLWDPARGMRSVLSRGSLARTHWNWLLRFAQESRL